MSTREHISAIAVALVIGVIATGSAAAQGLTINDFRHPSSQTDLSFNKGYLTGVKDGLIALNMTLDQKLFCLPGEVPILSFEQASDLMVSWARKKGSNGDDIPINRALLTALREHYPCRAR